MICVLDYGFGNIKSIANALKQSEISFKILDDLKNLKNFKKIILPGVGSFSPAMSKLKKIGFDDRIKKFVENKDNSLLGICLGMQLLTSFGFENQKEEGLNLISGESRYLKKNNLYTHHVGWNNINLISRNRICKGITHDIDFYFCHSIYVKCEKKYIVAETEFHFKFPSIINNENIYGIQFHPEKSHFNGLKILKNFSKL
tara:strand:+ start:86 stop:688 length:603 start_codon:yes stop_codon:yes gene_type:complete